MSAHINTDTGEYPRYEGDARLLNPNIPECLTGEAFPWPSNFAPVARTDEPAFDLDTQIAYEGPPQRQVDGGWVMNWQVRNLTDEELAVRAQMMALRPKLADLTIPTQAPDVL